METCENRVRITTKAMRLLLFAAAFLIAHGAWADYVQLPRIGTTGYQLVATDFKLSSTDTIEVKFRTQSDLSGNQNIFCNRKGASQYTYTLFLIAGTPRWDYSSGSQNQKSADDPVETYTTYVVKCNGATGVWTVNGVEQSNGQTPASFTPGGPLAFFSSYASGADSGTTYSGGNNNSKVMFFYAKIWGADETLKHHLVPAQDTSATGTGGEYGLLDIAQSPAVFYANTTSTALSWEGDGNIVWSGAASTLLSDSGNWVGDSGDMKFLGEATATLDGDWTAAQGKGNVFVDTIDGEKVVFDLGAGNTLTLTNNFYLSSNNAEVELVSGTIGTSFSSWTQKGFYVGNIGGTTSTAGYKDTRMVVSNATLTTLGEVRVGNGLGASGNSMIVKDGATMSVNEFVVGAHGSTNNTIEVTGGGTSLTTLRRTFLGISTSANKLPVGNKFIVSDGATAALQGGSWGVCAGTAGESNAIEVCSGGTLSLGGRNNMFIGAYTNYWQGIYGKNTRISVCGSGSALTDANTITVANGNESPDDAHLIEVLDGGSFAATGLSFSGYGNRLVLSNGTASVSGKFVTNAALQGPNGGTNTTVRFEGTTPVLSLTSTTAADAPALDGKAVFEYAFSAAGYAAAPYQTKTAINVPADFTISVSEDAVKAILEEGTSPITIPLMSTTDVGGITLADQSALEAKLPSKCSLVIDNESATKTLSLKMAKGGLIIIFS